MILFNSGNWRNIGKTLIAIIVFLSTGSIAYCDVVYTPNATSGLTGGSSYCSNAVTAPLIFTFSTCNAGGGTTSGITITRKWYYNTTNSTVVAGATLVDSTVNFCAVSATDTATFLPTSTVAGIRYYFCVLTWVGAGTCNTSGVLSSSTSMVTVIPAPAISTVSPLKGYTGSSVTISGSNFNSSPGSNLVWFGATRATVTSGSSTSLSVTAPTGAIYMPVSVTDTGTGCGLSDYAQYPYLPTFDTAPYIRGVVNFDSRTDFGTGANPYGIAIGDLDGDGKPDLAVANNGASTISVFRNTSTSGSISSGSFASGVSFATGAGPVQIAISDLDGDGKADLAVANNYSSTVSVLRNTSTSGSITFGSFATRVDFSAGSSGFLAGATSVAIGDIDGDGKSDIAVTNFSGIVRVLRNSGSPGSIGSGSFSSAVDFATGSGPASVAIGDIDSDGKADLVVACQWGDLVSVFRNTSSIGSISSGSFASRVDFATGRESAFVAIGDLDGDGKPDLATANYSGSSISVLRNTSTPGSISSGSFASAVNFGVGYLSEYVAIGDFNGDGKPDMAVNNRYGTGVSVLLNTSSAGSIHSGSFASRVDFAAGSGTISVAVGDLDGDGKADLAAANYDANTISVLKNNPLYPIAGAGSLCAGATRTLTDSTTGGNWSSSATGTATVNSTTGVVTGVAAGTAVITYTVAGGFDTALVTILAVTATPVSSSICLGTSTNITASGASTYSWSPATGLSATTGATVVASPTITTTYTVTGTPTFGCPSTASQTITVNPLPSSSFSISSSPVCINTADTFTSGAPLCSVNALVTSSSAASYARGVVASVATDNITMEAWVKWNGTNGRDQMIMLNGNLWLNGYGVAVRSGTSTLSILVAGVAWLSTTATLTSGSWQHVTVVRRSGSWEIYVDGTSYSVTSATTAPIAPNGRFFVSNDSTSVDNFNGTIDEVKFWNTARTTTEIAADRIACYTSPQAALAGYWKFDESTGSTAADASSNGRTLTLSGTSFAASSNSLSTYAWSFGDGATASINSAVRTYTASGTYSPSLTVTNAYGCVSTTANSLTVTPVPTVTATASATTVCSGNNSTLSASGATNYTWSPSAGLSASTGATVTFSGTTTATYTVTGTTGGCSATASLTITVNPTPTVTITPAAATICAGNTTNMTASGATTYTWSPATGLSASTGATVAFSGTATATYTVAGTNAAGCTSSGTVTVTVISATATISVISGPAVVHTGSAYSVLMTDTASGGSWSSTNTGVATVTSDGVVTGVSAGTATISYVVTNVCGTTSVAKSITVNAVCTQLINNFAGSGFTGYTGDGGAATAAKLDAPTGIAVDGSGNVYISDRNNNGIRRIGSSGIITTFAGTGTAGYSGDGGAATAAKFYGVTDVAVDGSGNVYVADYGNNRIRQINSSRIVTTIAGSGTAGFSGDGGAATAARLTNPSGVAIDRSGNVYVADYGNNRIRRISTSGIITTIAGSDTLGFSGDGGAATAARLNRPRYIALDGSGNLYLSDVGNIRIRRISANGIISTIAGTGTSGYSGDGGAATAANLNAPQNIAIDSGGIVYIADWQNKRIRRISASGIITTVAGSGSSFSFGDGGAATAAGIGDPTGVAIDGSGNVYLGNVLYGQIRKVSKTVIVPAITGSASVCTGNTATLSNALSGGTWTTSASSIASVSVAGVVNGVAAGRAIITYSYTDYCGSGMDTQLVTINLPPTVSVTATASTICPGSSTTLTASGATTYSWSPSTGLSASTGATVTFSGTTTATYTVTGTSLGCSGTASQTIAVNPAPIITSVSPLKGYTPSSVTISGSNFNSTANRNIVWFGATKATITSGSATSLSVTAPIGATYMPVSVTDTGTGCGLSGYTQNPYLPTFDTTPHVRGIVNVDARTDFTTGTAPYAVAIGDLDGDGKADLAVANVSSNSISVFRNTSSSGSISSGSFATRVDFTTGTAPYSVAIGDLDGDGKADLAVANFSSASVGVFRNISSSGSISSGSFASRVDFTTGTQPSSVAIGDLDGDGKADLAVSNFSSASVSVLRNTSSSGGITSGSFASTVDFTTGTSPHSVAIGDLDGDGKADLAVANFNSNSVSVFRNTSSSGSISSGSFASRVDFTTGSNPRSVVIGDLDGDGKADLATSNQSSNSVSVLRNTSTSGSISSGSFATGVEFTMGTAPWSVAIGDQDGDGKADLAVANQSSATVSVLRNTSTTGSISSGSFASRVDFTTGIWPRSVAIGDLDGDGKADLAVANSSSNSVSVLRNNPLYPIVGAGAVCTGSTRTLTDSTSGGTWISSATGIATVSATGVVTGVAAGTVIITYAVNGGSDTALVTVNATPIVTVTPVSSSICIGSTTDIAASGAATYSWAPSVGLSATTSATVAFSGTTTTTYTITGTSALGCVSTASQTITVNPVPSSSFTVAPSPVCIATPATFNSGAPLCSVNSLVTSSSAASYARGAVVSTATNNITMEAWVKWNGTNGRDQMIMLNGSLWLNGYGVATRAGSSSLTILVSSVAWLTTSATLTTGTWQHIAVVRRSGSWEIYVDGTSYSVTGATTAPATPNGRFFVSNDSTAVDNFNGTIDEVKFWTAARTPSEIAADRIACYTAPSANLGGYWKFDEASGSTSADASGNGRTLSLNATSFAASANSLSTYAWSFGDASSSTANGVTHSYTTATTFTPTLTVTNAYGCTSTSTNTVNVTPVPVLTVTPVAAAVCRGSTTSITASGATTYTWAPATGLSATTGVTVTFSGTVTTTYTVTGTASGCSATATQTITVYPVPVLTITPVASTFCQGSATSISASGATSYTWSPSTGLSATTGATVTASPTTTTTYTVTGTGAGGCSITSTQLITVNPSPSSAFGVSATTTCTSVADTFTSGAPLCSVNAYNMGGTRYGSTSLFNSAVDNITVEAWVKWSNTTTSGTNQLLFLNGNSGTSGYGLLIRPGTNTLTILLGGVVYLNSTAVLSYGQWQHVGIVRNAGTWSVYVDGTQYSVSTPTTAPNTPTTGFFVGSNNIGAENFNGIVDEVKFWSAARTTANIQADRIACYTAPQTNFAGYWKFDEGSGTTVADGSGNSRTLTLSSSAGWVTSPISLNTYAWSFGDASTATANGATHSYTAAGTYTPTLTVTNAYGCTTTTTSSITVNTTPTITVSPSITTFCSGGSTTLTASGTTAYSWSPSTDLSAPTGATVTATPTTTTTYTVIGISAAGCTDTSTQLITVNPVPSSSYTISPSPVCISTPATFNSGAPLCSVNAFNMAGSRNANRSLFSTATDNITVEAWVKWNNTSTPSANQFIFINGNSGSSGYGLILRSGTNTLSILLAGVTFLHSSAVLNYGQWQHVAIVRNSGTWSVYVDGTAYTVTTPTTSPITPTTGFYVASNNSGTEYFNGIVDEVKFWTAARNATNIQADRLACYTAPQTNFAGYWKFDEGSGTTVADGSGNSRPLTLSSSAGWVASPLTLNTYAWSFGDGSISTANNVAHTYTSSATYTTTLTVTGYNGCTSVSSDTIMVTPVPVLTVTPVAATVCIGSSTNITASGGITYSWSPASGLSVTSGSSVIASPTVTTTYTVIGVSGLGGNCRDTTTQTITIAPPLSVAIASVPTPCDGTSGNIVINGSHGDTVTYSVDGGSYTNGVVTGSVYNMPTGIISGTHTYLLHTARNAACVQTIDTTVTVYTVPVTWLGNRNSNWNNDTNWSCGAQPLATQNVLIPAGTTYLPVLPASTNGYANNLNIDSGTSISVGASAMLHVKSNLYNSASITGAGKLSMNGSSAQTIYGIGDINNMELNNSFGAYVDSTSRLTINNTLYLTNGTLTTNDSLVLNSDSLLTARVAPIAAGAAIAGNVKVKQWIQGGMRRFRFWSHPFSNNIGLEQVQNNIDVTGPGGAANGFTSTVTNAPSAFCYNPNTGNSSLAYDPGWRPFTSTFTTVDSNRIHRFQGIRIFVRGKKNEGLGYTSYSPSPVTVWQYGTLNQGSLTVIMHKGSGANQDYNMLGNPYASPVDIGTVLFNARAAGNIAGGAFYIWNPTMGAAGQFQTYPIGTGSATPYYLPANCAFQVRTAHDGDSLNFNESNKNATATASLLKAIPEALSLVIYDGNYHPYDVFHLLFDATSDDADDNYHDAEKLSGPDFNFYSRSSNNKKLSIDVRPFKENSIVPLGVFSSLQQNFIIRASQYNFNDSIRIYLRDKFLHQSVLLKSGVEYSFIVSADTASKGDNRFELSLNPTERSAVADFSFTATPNPSSGRLTISYSKTGGEHADLRITDLKGCTIYSTDLGSATTGNIHVNMEQFVPGIYTVELTSGNAKMTKIIVKQ